MSSILTNNGAMIALQTLKMINADLGKIQSQISTGKNVASSKDNAAIWAISKVMESDVKGFKAISDSLSLGESTVAVARKGSETVSELLITMKGKIVASQESNVDRAKIQTDIDALQDQINAVVGAAQFNGLSLLSNSATTVNSGNVNVLSSLDRSGSGVTAAQIAVGKNDLTMKARSVVGGAAVVSTAAVTLGAVQTATLAVNSPLTTGGRIFSIGLAGIDADASKFVPANYTTGATLPDMQKIMYITRDGDTAADVAKGLAQSFQIFAAKNNIDTNVLNVAASGNSLSVSSKVTDATDTIAVRIDGNVTATTVVIGGGLEEINNFDVTTEAGARSALISVEAMIQTAVDSAASFGSVEGRIETQARFVSGLTDSLRTGIGTLVDADMEEASARLQALQVQQQLGVQSLSIANQAPQSVLSLFR